MLRFRKVAHHSLSATKSHTACTSTTEWCPIKYGNDKDYKSDKFVVKGEAQCLPVSRKANAELIKQWNKYWTFDLVKACIWGKKTNGTQSNEAFNHVRAGFTNKMLSIKDDVHFEGQCCLSVLQYNEGFKTIIDKLEDIGFSISKQQRVIVKKLSRKRQRNSLHSKNNDNRKKRNLKKRKLNKLNNDDSSYESNKFIDPN